MPPPLFWVGHWHTTQGAPWFTYPAPPIRMRGHGCPWPMRPAFHAPLMPVSLSHGTRERRMCTTARPRASRQLRNCPRHVVVERGREGDYCSNGCSLAQMGATAAFIAIRPRRRWQLPPHILRVAAVVLAVGRKGRIACKHIRGGLPLCCHVVVYKCSAHSACLSMPVFVRLGLVPLTCVRAGTEQRCVQDPRAKPSGSFPVEVGKAGLPDINVFTYRAISMAARCTRATQVWRRARPWRGRGRGTLASRRLRALGHVGCRTRRAAHFLRARFLPVERARAVCDYDPDAMVASSMEKRMRGQHEFDIDRVFQQCRPMRATNLGTTMCFSCTPHPSGVAPRGVFLVMFCSLKAGGRLSSHIRGGAGSPSVARGATRRRGVSSSAVFAETSELSGRSCLLKKTIGREGPMAFARHRRAPQAGRECDGVG